MKIQIETIPHSEQRYPTVGDWWYPSDDLLVIRVSKMSDPRMEEAVAIHELFEARACAHAGITQKQVDEFDMMFEKEREQGLHNPSAEPGDDHRAPYYTQHQFATSVERSYAALVGLDWNTYAKEIESFP
jgi:hypothetical protein